MSHSYVKICKCCTSCFHVVRWDEHQFNKQTCDFINRFHNPSLPPKMFFFPLRATGWGFILNPCTFALLIYLSLISSSPDMPENEATFAISAGGVTDAKEWRATRGETHVSAGLPHSHHFKLFIEFNNILNWESCSFTFDVLYLKPLFYFWSVSLI